MEQIILLVEDNENDVLLTQRAFKKMKIGNKIVVAKDGVEALELLHGPDPITPSLILLDLKLPKVDGLSVLDSIRENERTATFPVVVLTTSTEEDDVIKSYQKGANSYIRKPVDFSEFTDAVGKLGVYWLIINESPLK